jgi:hypothetical protein
MQKDCVGKIDGIFSLDIRLLATNAKLAEPTAFNTKGKRRSDKFLCRLFIQATLAQS